MENLNQFMNPRFHLKLVSLKEQQDNPQVKIDI